MKAKAVINEALIVRCLRKKNKSDEEGKNQIVRNIDDVDFATLSELALSYECTCVLFSLSLTPRLQHSPLLNSHQHDK